MDRQPLATQATSMQFVVTVTLHENNFFVFPEKLSYNVQNICPCYSIKYVLLRDYTYGHFQYSQFKLIYSETC